jgi:hypothetical protein
MARRHGIDVAAIDRYRLRRLPPRQIIRTP